MAGSDLNSPRALLAAALSAAAGFCGWAIFAFGTASREAWDTDAWWVIALPILAVLAGILGYVVPRRVWRWAAWIVLGELLAILVIHQAGSGLGLLPLTIVFVMVPLGIGFTAAAMIGAVLARGVTWDSAILW